ncbi:MAG TPA: hypothetical protein VLG44_06900 [Chlamydiales bacterium]|nr:hypothetical protein [Chlamydiales bacterium]
MRTKRGAAIGLIVLGIIFIFISQHIQHKINIGEGEISSGQSQVDQTQSMFNWNPITKGIGKGFTSGAEARIAAGEAEIEHYQGMAHTLLVIGIIAVVAGIIIFVLFEFKLLNKKWR